MMEDCPEVVVPMMKLAPSVWQSVVAVAATALPRLWMSTNCGTSSGHSPLEEGRASRRAWQELPSSVQLRELACWKARAEAAVHRSAAGYGAPKSGMPSASRSNTGWKIHTRTTGRGSAGVGSAWEATQAICASWAVARSSTAATERPPTGCKRRQDQHQTIALSIITHTVSLSYQLCWLEAHRYYVRCAPAGPVRGHKYGAGRN
mmetsp:Transcript_31149/g.88333  ORF Transcript_31149/g.88333 Transcript_31149/m.88333 type:complete len:205 (-) Transcript_31149:423-1037(-)